MKTNFQTTVLALALMLGVTGVFAKNISNSISGKKRVAYSWQKYLPDGVTPDGDPVPGTETENPFASQCPDNGLAVCAIGSPVNPGAGLVHIVRYLF